MEPAIVFGLGFIGGVVALGLFLHWIDRAPETTAAEQAARSKRRELYRAIFQRPSKPQA